MEGPLHARVQVKVGDRKPVWWALPQWEVVSVGRMSGYGIHLPNSWIPRKLCRFLPYEHGWVVQVGPRARMLVQDRYVGTHVFGRRAMVAVQPGKTYLGFPELDDWCQLGLVIETQPTGNLPEAHDNAPEEGGFRTDYAVERVTLTPKQKTYVATSYRHLWRGGPAPANIAADAAPHLGVQPQVVKNVLGAVKKKVNIERWGPKFDSNEDVAHYLMHLTRTVVPDDLPPSLR